MDEAAILQKMTVQPTIAAAQRRSRASAGVVANSPNSLHSMRLSAKEEAK
jgi:hypothetical protein